MKAVEAADLRAGRDRVAEVTPSYDGTLRGEGLIFLTEPPSNVRSA